MYPITPITITAVIDKAIISLDTRSYYICGSWFPWESSGSTLLVCDQKS